MRIGFTGINGWIGGYISKFLFNEKHDIINLDKWTRNKIIGLPKGKNPKIDWAFHFGASTSIDNSFSKPFDFYQNNINSTLKLLQIVKDNSAKLVFMSSYLYGIPKYLPIDEKHSISTINPYISSKFLSEQICIEICKQLEVDFVIFRLFNVYAPGVCRGRLISDLIESGTKGLPFNLNDPLPKRDYLYVKDLAHLLTIFIENGIKKSGEIYNIASGFSYSNYEVTRIVESVIESRMNIITLDKKRKNDVLNIEANIKKIYDDYNWKAKYDLKSGLLDLLTGTKMGGVTLL